MAENLCANCRENCCRELLFSPLMFSTNQIEIISLSKQILTSYPMFRIGRQVETEHGTQYPVFVCTRYDPQRRICLDYDNRPDLCRQAGIEHNPGNCPLWDRVHGIKPKKRFFFF